MHTKQPMTCPLLAVALATSLHAQTQNIVVPSTHTTNDAVSINQIAGTDDIRQQTLIGANHLTAMVGKSITAIEFRRSAADEIYAGGTVNMIVTLSTSTSSTLAASSTFADNVGTASTQTFHGAVTFPTSPPALGPTVTWSPNNVVRIQFTTPFAYAGGRLTIDITGAPIAGQEPGWWMADAEFEDIPATVTDLGGGCGTFANMSFVSKYPLVVGGHAYMSAYGTPYGLAIAAIGQPGNAIPLHALGFATPGSCDLMLSTLDILEPMLFLPDPDPLLAPMGARAHFELKIPNVPGAQGLTLATQWFDWTETATTNAIQWTVASIPTLDMALIEGHPQEAKGTVSVHKAHVFRFDYQ